VTWCQSLDWVDAYDRLEQTAIGDIIRQSSWLFPGIEAVHLLGLAMLGGSIIVVDLRLFGIGLTRLSSAQVLGHARPWFLGSIVVMLATGIPLFLSEAIKCCFNHSFEVKIAALVGALIFTFAVRNRVATSGDSPIWMRRIAATISLGLWFTVAAAGRWIGFSG